MKSTKLIGVSAVVLAIVSLVVIPGRMAAQDQEGSRKQVHYSVQKLGTLGGTSSSGNGINNKDRVTGTANLQGDRYFHAFLWRKGVMTDLGTFGGNSFVGWAPNERGEIAGYSETSTQDPLGEDFCGNGTGLVCRGFVWQDGVMTPLSTLGGNNGAATQNNNLGQVAGFAENSTKDPACISPQARDYGAVVWGPKKARSRNCLH